jgi:hypothetical protein
MRLLRHLVLLLLLFPPVAFADSTGWFFGNTGGLMTYDPTTHNLTLTSTITTIIGVGRFGAQIEETGGDFGTITLTTGPLISGSILHHALFDGGTITLIVDTGISTGSGTLIPFTLFGTLNTPLTWWVDKLGGDHLGGAGFGTINGEGVHIWDFGQLAVSSGTNQYNVIRGRTTIPEPGTVVLVVTGLGFLAYRTKSRCRPIQ